MEKTMWRDRIAELTFPGFAAEDLSGAFAVLRHCLIEELPAYGFESPFFAPGGHYGAKWWQLDSSLALLGCKWVDFKLAQKALLNFEYVQKDDGRIPLYGDDVLPEAPHVSRQRHEVSSLPKFFDVAFNLTCATDDTAFLTRVFRVGERYLDWFFCARMEPRTGLFSAVFEETFIPYLGRSLEVAPVDLNVEIMHGCYCWSRLAARLNNKQMSARYLERGDSIKAAIRKYLYDDSKGCFRTLDLRTNHFVMPLMGSMFGALRHRTADERQTQSLLQLLLDDAKFNWRGHAITTVAKDDPDFIVTRGNYLGNPSWSGSVWSLTNESTIRGLLDINERELAAKLALKTVSLFNGKWSEFADPFDGSPHGVKMYAWTAAQYLQIFIEIIFGISYDGETRCLSVCPCVDSSLDGKLLKLDRLFLPNSETISVSLLRQGRNVFIELTHNNQTIKAINALNA